MITIIILQINTFIMCFVHMCGKIRATRRGREREVAETRKRGREEYRIEM